MTRTIHCRFCDQALPLSVEDRESWPILVDMLVQCHETRCDRYLSLAGDVLATEAGVYLKVATHG